MSDEFDEVTIGTHATTGVDGFGVSWRTTDIAGWSGSPASTSQQQQKTRGHGAWGSRGFMVARPLGPAGVIDAPDRASAVAAIDRLNAAVTLEDTRLTVVEGDLIRWCMVRRQDEVLQSKITDALIQWSVQVVANEPRKFADPVTASTGLPSALGGHTIPYTIPYSITSTIVTGSCLLNNPGNETGPVKLRISGPSDPLDPPLVGPAVTHVSTGHALVFSTDLVIGSGQWIDVDMENQLVLANGQATRNGDITSRGWSGFDEGPNIWSFAAESGVGTLDVTAWPAWK